MGHWKEATIVDYVTRLRCNESPFILIIYSIWILQHMSLSTCHSNKGFGQYTNYQLLYECVLCNIVIVNLSCWSVFYTDMFSICHLIIWDQCLSYAWNKPGSFSVLLTLLRKKYSKRQSFISQY